MPCQTPYRGDTSQMLLFKIASCLADGGFVSGVSSFNGLTGAVTFTGADIIALLGCTPACEGDVVNSFNTRTGDVVLTLADVSTVADARYVLKTGDSMTGLLTITTAATSLQAITSDAGAANTPLTFEIYHRTSATPAVGFGNRFQFYADTDGANDQIQARIDAQWVDATDATRSSRLVFGTRNTGGVISSPLILSGGQTQVLSGLVTVPGLTFQNDPDTGLYSIGANSLGITVGGVLVAAFTGTTGIILSTSLTLPYVAKVATYTATALDYTIDCTSGTFDVDLPTAVGITGRIYVIKNSGVGTITIDPAGAELIDSLATATLVSGASITTQSTGTGWIII